MGRPGVATTRQLSLSEHLHTDSERQQGSAVHGDILAMLPRRLTVADVSILHPRADTYVQAAATTAGAAAKVRDDQKYRKYYPAGSAVYRMVPRSYESYVHLGQPASQLLNELAILASSSEAVGKAQFVESALRELSVTLCRGNHRIVAAYAAPDARMTGSALIPGLPVVLLCAAADNARCLQLLLLPAGTLRSLLCPDASSALCPVLHSTSHLDVSNEHALLDRSL